MPTRLMWMLFGLGFAVVNGWSNIFQFEKGLEYNQTCGMNQKKEWSFEGPVTLTQTDLYLWQPKVVITAVKEVCTVDLTRCPPDPLPSSALACYCKSKTNNKYNIHVASTLEESQGDVSVKASIPGQGVFHNVFTAGDIGSIPSLTRKTSHVNTSFTIGDGNPKDLLPAQTVSLCPDKRFLLEICIATVGGHHNAELKITVASQTTKTVGGKCVAMKHKFTSGEDRSVVFEYVEPKGCSQRSIIHFTDDLKLCMEPTSPPPPPPTTPPTTPIPTLPPNQVAGICPDTPRVISTLPDGTEVLKDEVSFNKSWIIFQRRIADDERFYRSWADYENGFGKLKGSFWLGLKKLQRICNSRNKCEMLVNLIYPDKPAESSIKQVPNNCYHAFYGEFYLHNAADKYRLNIGRYSGTAGDSLMWIKRWKFNHDNMRFSTFDNDNDKWSKSCAYRLDGGWWYNACSASNPNGRWDGRGTGSMSWVTLTDTEKSVQFTELKVRRR